jgi:hypothetical protein
MSWIGHSAPCRQRGSQAARRSLALAGAVALAAAAQSPARPAVISPGSGPAAGSPADGSDAAPVRIQLAPGKSSTSVAVDFSGNPRSGGIANPPGAPTPGRPSSEPAVAPAAIERRFVLAAWSGQTLKIDLRAPGGDPGVTLSLRCPGDGHTAVGRNGRLQGSVALPESGDYTILLIGKPGAGPAVLQIELAGSPNRIAARPYTGTYYRQDGSRTSIDVRETFGGRGGPGGEAGQAAPRATGGGREAATGADGGAGPRLAYSVAAAGNVPSSPGGPNSGAARGTVTLRDGVGIDEKDGCRLTFRFGRPGTGQLRLDEAGDCGFGHSFGARGDYRRTSLCSAE